MNNNTTKRLNFKFKIIFFLFFLLTLLGTALLVYATKINLFGIEKSDWLGAFFSWISAMSAVSLGLVAYWQNERFKNENNISAQKAEELAAKHNKELVEINNRLLQLEENKEKAYITFSQTVIQIFNDSDNFKLIEKPYMAGFPSANSDKQGAGIFLFKLINLTDTPIRYIEVLNMNISYTNYYTDESSKLLSFAKGGFIPSPVTEKNKEFLCAFVVPGAKNIFNNIPQKSEINIRLTTSVESIFGRQVEQVFLLRLQRENACFKATDEHSFFLYCYASGD